MDIQASLYNKGHIYSTIQSCKITECVLSTVSGVEVSTFNEYIIFMKSTFLFGKIHRITFFGLGTCIFIFIIKVYHYELS